MTVMMTLDFEQFHPHPMIRLITIRDVNHVLLRLIERYDQDLFF